jgi:hypothetical protein
VVGTDGVAVFDALHRRRKASDAVLYAFDLLELDGEELRPVPLSARKAKLLAGKPAGIVFNEHTDEDGAVVFRHACKLGFEGIVSKRLASPYRSGPSRDWARSGIRTARRCGGLGRDDGNGLITSSQRPRTIARFVPGEQTRTPHWDSRPRPGIL